MVETVALVLLAVMNIIQGYAIFKLIDRLMSRNYYDFKTTDNLEPKREIPKVIQEEEEPEDLGYLSGI